MQRIIGFILILIGGLVIYDAMNMNTGVYSFDTFQSVHNLSLAHKQSMRVVIGSVIFLGGIVLVALYRQGEDVRAPQRSDHAVDAAADRAGPTLEPTSKDEPFVRPRILTPEFQPVADKFLRLFKALPFFLKAIALTMIAMIFAGLVSRTLAFLLQWVALLLAIGWGVKGLAGAFQKYRNKFD